MTVFLIGFGLFTLLSWFALRATLNMLEAGQREIMSEVNELRTVIDSHSDQLRRIGMQ